MIFLKLFLTFLKIGTVSFGGGYGMISIIRETVVNEGWMTDSDFMSFLAIAESTPGPIAVNMATYIGSVQGGALGGALATLGVVLPAFIAVIIIFTIIKNLLKYEGVKAFLRGVRPAVVGMIIATAVTMGLKVVFSLTALKNGFSFDYKALVILACVVGFSHLFKKIKEKKPSPIILILFSAALGIVFYY